MWCTCASKDHLLQGSYISPTPREHTATNKQVATCRMLPAGSFCLGPRKKPEVGASFDAALRFSRAHAACLWPRQQRMGHVSAYPREHFRSVAATTFPLNRLKPTQSRALRQCCTVLLYRPVLLSHRRTRSASGSGTPRALRAAARPRQPRGRHRRHLLRGGWCGHHRGRRIVRTSSERASGKLLRDSGAPP